jgi:hypothetical protein
MTLAPAIARASIARSAASRQPVPAGTFLATTTYQAGLHIACMEEDTMDGLIYLVGLIVIILAILSFFGLR